MSLVYDEWYGELSVAERKAIKKYNVSPSDHQMLSDEFGDCNHEAITKAIIERSSSGMYRMELSW
jgi:hypothetical protein